jgi:hypothetical protein
MAMPLSSQILDHHEHGRNEEPKDSLDLAYLFDRQGRPSHKLDNPCSGQLNQLDEGAPGLPKHPKIQQEGHPEHLSLHGQHPEPERPAEVGQLRQHELQEVEVGLVEVAKLAG